MSGAIAHALLADLGDDGLRNLAELLRPHMTDAEAADPAAVVTVPRLLKVSTAALLLDCHPRTVQRRISDGSLPAVLEHGRTMVRADDLRAYIDALERPGRTAPRRAPRASAARYDFLHSTGT